jgi:hypothetical protein
MFLVSITPGDGCAVRVYSCTLAAWRGIADVKLDHVPGAEEVRDMVVNPQHALADVGPEAA